jgi:hypothetical protein
MAEKAKNDSAVNGKLDHSMRIRSASGPLRFCRNYRSVGLGTRRYWYFLFEYEGAINEIAFGYTKVIGILRTKDDRLFWVLVWVVKE